MASPKFFIGVDVGTGSVRAGVFDAKGRMLAVAVNEIRTWKPQAEYVEQSSEDIWSMVCKCVREAMGQAAIAPEFIGGLGFDATCSLVVLDENDRPVAVTPDAEDERNIIVWMDHRAVEQAERINAHGHPVLQYVGGRVSPEMQTPKLLWLKENLPYTWERAARFLDLPDFLTYRATGDETRSLCTTVCKWTYLGHEKSVLEGSVGRWDDSYFQLVGLGDLVRDGYRRIGTRVRPLGECVGSGLSSSAAEELGLLPGTAVSVSIIDAHAGGLGLLGATTDGELTKDRLLKRVALIGGTSSCHMAVSQTPLYVPGVWGPYYSAMIPEMWLTEGGQSATGALVDHVIFSHARGEELRAEAQANGTTVYDLLNVRLERMAQAVRFPAELASQLHVLPYFHGNRSPRADASLRGAIEGLRLSSSVDDLALIYLATIQAIAQGTRHIIEEMNSHGYEIDTIFACGGGTKNPVFLREHADASGCRIVLPAEPESVLLGAAMLGAVAAGRYSTVLQAMQSMSGIMRSIEPAHGAIAEYHKRKRQVFHRMYENSIEYRKIMASDSF